MRDMRPIHARFRGFWPFCGLDLALLCFYRSGLIARGVLGRLYDVGVLAASPYHDSGCSMLSYRGAGPHSDKTTSQDLARNSDQGIEANLARIAVLAYIVSCSPTKSTL